jgi:O-antigen ligase
VITVPDKIKRSGAVAARLSSDTFWMAALLVVMISKIGNWVQALNGLPLVKITFAITLITTLRAGKLPSPIRALSLHLARPAIAFQLLSMISILFSIYKSQTLIDMQSSVIYLIAIVLLVKITESVQDLARLLKALAIAGVLLAAGTLIQFAGGRANMEAWNSNDIAYALVTLLPLVLAQRSGRSRLARLVVYGVALLMVIATFLTGSRGGIVGLGVVVAALSMFPLDADKQGQLRRFNPGGALLRIVPMLAIGLLVWTHLPAETTERIATLEDLKGDYNLSPTIEASRTLIWRRDVGFALRRPIGYGMGTSETVDGVLGKGQWRAAHNSLVQVFVELGVLGLVIYLTAYYRAWRGLAAVLARHRQQLPSFETAGLAVHARALSIALAGNFAAGFFLSQAYSALLWMLIAVCAALVRLGTPAYGVAVGARVLSAAPGGEIAAK